LDINTILTFIAVATLLVISPGPNGFLIAKTVPISGRKAGMANIWGFVGAFYIHGTLSVFGISILLVQSAQAFFVFKMVGAAYLVWIGLKALYAAIYDNKTTRASSPQKSNKVSLKGALLEGFLTNVLNPKVSMFYLAAFPQFISTSESIVNAYTLVTAHSIVNVVWFSLMIVMLSKVKATANSARFKRWLNAITGVVFIAFGSKLALLKNG